MIKGFCLLVVTTGLLRAAVETEKELESPRFIEVRRGSHIFVALDRPLADWALKFTAPFA